MVLLFCTLSQENGPNDYVLYLTKKNKKNEYKEFIKKIDSLISSVSSNKVNNEEVVRCRSPAPLTSSGKKKTSETHMV